MSRVYQKPSTSPTRRPPAAVTGASQRSTLSTSTASRLSTRGARAPSRGRTMHTQPPRHEHDENNSNDDNGRTKQQERTTHIGDGYHMFTPSTTKREQMRRQAESEQRQYEAHVDRRRLHGIHEIHRLGGDQISEDEVRRRQAEKYRRDKFTRLEKIHQDQSEKKQGEDEDIQAKKQAARQQAMANEERERATQLRSMRPTDNSHNQGATGWTDEAREDDRRETMDRFMNRFSRQYDDMNISSDKTEKKNQNNPSKSEKLSILHDMLPHIDDQTLEYHLEIFDGNVDAVVHELLN